MKACLEILLAQIDAQIKAIEEDHKRAKVWGYLPDAKEEFQAFFDDDDQQSAWVFQIRLADGSYPLVPLLAAKAQVLHALTMIQVTEVT